MKDISKKLSKSLTSICLAGTLLAGNSCAKSYESHKIKANSLAVLVIDMQDYWLGDIDKEELETELPYQAEVLEYCKNNNIPVFVVEFTNCGHTTDYLKKKIERLPIRDYVVKNKTNAFEGTELEKRLKEKNVETLILMGVYASACVKETAKGAINAGFKIATSKELIADDRHHNKGDTIEWYKEKGVYKDSYKEILSLIEK